LSRPSSKTSLDYIVLAGAKELFNDLTYSRDPYGECESNEKEVVKAYLQTVIKDIEEKIG
jgi:hypothetical protein